MFSGLSSRSVPLVPFCRCCQSVVQGRSQAAPNLPVMSDPVEFSRLCSNCMCLTLIVPTTTARAISVPRRESSTYIVDKYKSGSNARRHCVPMSMMPHDTMRRKILNQQTSISLALHLAPIERTRKKRVDLNLVLKFYIQVCPLLPPLMIENVKCWQHPAVI